MIELSPAKARAVARFGGQFIRAGDHISYFQPLFVSGKRPPATRTKCTNYTRVLRVNPTDEYPLRITTEELLDLEQQQEESEHKEEDEEEEVDDTAEQEEGEAAAGALTEETEE
ncbi:hypothetical protein PF006_g16081 [Phytophthora fragariae]|nr:hypothetical protein PF003_g17821 [Phytophthora fragariae]KAE9129195.1 hypothetical protein PF006_g16081 [Phytophthora fragariae]